MIVTTEYVDIPVGAGAMRLFVAAPKAEGTYPGLLCYSDIFQLTGPTLRACVRFAGYGFVVAAPEIYHRLEPPGAVIPFDDDGRTRGLDNAVKTSVAEFDEDCRATLDFLSRHPKVARGKLGATGFCIGGHLAFRAALQPDVNATVCFYATGVHSGKLGRDADAGSLQRAADITGELLLVWGEADPHIPAAGRETIHAALDAARVRYAIETYPAEHAFMRDEGPRYDPEATDRAFAEAIGFFHRTLGR
jgi:carboxymethylenebutenolidase